MSWRLPRAVSVRPYATKGTPSATSVPPELSEGRTAPARDETVTGPWLCADPANGWDWAAPKACKRLCELCTTRKACAERWVSLPLAQRRYSAGVWAGFNVDEPLERNGLRRWLKDQR